MREFTRQALMDAFWSLYKERPIEKISIREICERAGYNRSTFYEYFTDSYSVLESMEEELLDYTRTKLTQELPASLARSFPQVRLDSETLAPLVDLYAEKGEYFSVLIGAKGDPAFQYRYKRAVKDLLLQMLDDPTKKFGVSAGVVAEFTASALIGAFNYWYPRREEYPVEQYVVLLASLLKSGTISVIRTL